jgi:type IV secretory pathway VirB4 component
VVLDPDSEYEPLITLLGGSYVDLADTSINPLAVGRDLPVDEAAEVVVTVLSILGGDTVAYFGGRPVRRLPGEDKAWLHGQVASFLSAHGAGDAEPLLGDLVDGLRISLGEDASLSDVERDRYRRIALRLSGYTRGSLGRIFNRPSRLQIDGQAPVGIGFRSLSLRYAADLTPALAVVLAHVLGVLNQPHRPLIVLVDEAHVLTADPDAGQVLEQLVRRARKSGAGVWMASQRIEEFVSTDLGRTLASTAATKLVLGHEETVAAQVRELFDLAEDEATALTPPAAGRGVLIAGGERTVVQVTPSPVLWPWVRSDPEALEASVA